MTILEAMKSETKKEEESFKQEFKQTSSLPSDEDEKSVRSHISHHSGLIEEEEPTSILMEADILKIMDDLVNGVYDVNVQQLWKTVDSSQYEVEDSSVCFTSSKLTRSIHIFSQSSSFPSYLPNTLRME